MDRSKERSARQSAYRRELRKIADDQLDHIKRIGRYDALPVDEAFAQEMLDRLINEANDDRLELIAKRVQAEADLAALREQQQELYAQSPVDQEKINALGGQLTELQQGVPKMRTPIWKKEREIHDLLTKRLEGGELPRRLAHDEVPAGDPRSANEVELDERIAENERRLAAQRKALDELIARQMPEYQAKRAELQRERDAKKAEEDERRHARQQKTYEAQKAAREQRDAVIKQMRSAGVYKPPFAQSATDEQRAQDEQIIAGNTELQAMLAEQARIEKIKDEAYEAYKTLSRARPYNSDRVDAARERMRQTRSMGRDLPGKISRKRFDIEKLLRDRFEAQESPGS